MAYLHARFSDGTERIYGDVPATRPFARSQLRAIDSPAMQRAFAAIDAQARRTAFHTAKQRARRLNKRPDLLEMIQVRLSGTSPDKMILIGRALLMGERLMPISGADLLVSVQAINARAVMILGRFRRRDTFKEGLQRRGETHRTERV